MDVIASGNRLNYLYYLLELLAVWEERPACLTSLAFQWCSAVTEVNVRFGQGEIPIVLPRLPWHKLELAHQWGLRELRARPRPEQGQGVGDGLVLGLREMESELGLTPELRLELRRRLKYRHGRGFGFGLELQIRQQGPAHGMGPESLSSLLEREFSLVGPGYDLLGLDSISHRLQSTSEDITYDCVGLIPTILEVGFRLTAPGHDQPSPHPNRPHHEQIFKIPFSSYDDETIADAVYAWIANGDHTQPTSQSFVHYLSERMGRDEPFSPRLRQTSIHGIERTWRSEVEVSGLEAIRLLNRLEVNVDDVVDHRRWVRLLVGVIRSPMGLESLSSHYWRLLDKLVLAGVVGVDFVPRDAEVMGSLEEAEDWEKLEVWMVIVWESAEWFRLTGGVKPATLKLFSQRPSALPRFERIFETGPLRVGAAVELRRVCHKARAEQSPSDSPPP